jgi:hypothetical protein
MAALAANAVTRDRFIENPFYYTTVGDIPGEHSVNPAFIFRFPAYFVPF